MEEGGHGQTRPLKLRAFWLSGLGSCCRTPRRFVYLRCVQVVSVLRFCLLWCMRSHAFVDLHRSVLREVRRIGCVWLKSVSAAREGQIRCVVSSSVSAMNPHGFSDLISERRDNWRTGAIVYQLPLRALYLGVPRHR